MDQVGELIECPVHEYLQVPWHFATIEKTWQSRSVIVRDQKSAFSSSAAIKDFKQFIQKLHRN